MTRPVATRSARVSLLLDRPDCTRDEVCQKTRTNVASRLAGTYFASPGAEATRYVPAAFHLNDHGDFEKCVGAMRKIHKGNALRDAAKADKAGFVCRRFEWSNFIPDIQDINTSKETRSGGPMKETYRRSVEELGGAPTECKPLQQPQCPIHCTTNWGIFEPREGYRQGEAVTNERLLAYVRLKRIGNVALYSQILGHGDYLGLGIMFRLHLAILKWFYSDGRSDSSPLDLIMYGAVNSGGEGLMRWKKRGLFEATELVLPSSEIQP